MRTHSARVDAPSFEKIAAICFFTVFGAFPQAIATSEFV